MSSRIQAEPIHLNPINPHYFNYRGKPTVLITSDAAYGVVVTREYDYKTFLDTLSAGGMNFTRVYPGAVPPYWFGAPTILPWPKDPASGKYDLYRWDEDYFARLVGFVEYAEKKGVIVDICLFNGTGSFQGANAWYAHPTMALNPAHNLQGIGGSDARDVISVKDPVLLAVEESYVREIVRRLNRFDNVIYDVADEPDNVGDDRLADYTAWEERMLGVCYHAEDGLPNRHPISVCAAGKNWKAKNFATDPATGPMVSWISVEYTEFAKLDTHYQYNRPIVLIESGRYSSDGPPNREYNGSAADAINSSRAEAWEFLLGGAAGHMQFNCDWGYTVPRVIAHNPSAAGTTTPILLEQKQLLKEFMSTVDYLHMTPIQVEGVPAGAIARGIAEAGKQYACYMHHSHISRGKWPDFAAYTVDYGRYGNELIRLRSVPAGTYRVEWIAPATGAVLSATARVHAGGELEVTTPAYSYDIAVRIMATAGSKPQVSRLLRCAVAGLALVLGMAALRGAAPETAPTLKNGAFLFGADYQATLPESYKPLFYETGMNCVRLAGGGYGWSTEAHKKFADEFQARGLKVYMQWGSHYPPGSYFPLTGSYLFDQDGKTGVADRNRWAVTYSGQDWPQYSYATDELRKKLTEDFLEYQKHFTTNHNVAGMIMHNEPGLFWQDRVYDYNPTLIARFRVWLEQQHGTIARLNERWGTSFASFAEVTPPGKPPVEKIGGWMDWRRFQVVTIADFLTWEADLFRSQRPEIPVTTNMSGPLDHWYGYRCGDVYAHSTMMDKVGIDVYPATWTDRVFIPFAIDQLQGVAQGRDGHVLECETFNPGRGGERWKEYSEAQRADLLSSEVWTMIGHGTRGILLWVFGGGGNSITNGEFNDRLRTCRDIAHQTRMIGMDGFTRPRPDVALCIDPDAYIHATGVEAKPHSLSATLDSEARGLYAALADNHVAIDVIYAPQIQAGALKGYKVLVLSSAMMMDEATAKALGAFVADGGVLIADAQVAQMDRWGQVVKAAPGFGLDKVFGVHAAEAGSAARTDTISGRQGTITANEVRGGLTLAGAKAIGALPDGSPGITACAFGKGQAILFAGQVGSPYGGKSEEGLRTFFGETLKGASVASQATLSPVDVERLDTSTLRDARGNVLLVVSNLGSRGKLPPLAKQAQVNVAIGDSAALCGVFLFPPTQTRDGVVRSGPQRAVATASTTGVVVSLGDVVASTPLLLARDAGPLLAIEAPAKAKRGQEVRVTVTCFNPSERPLPRQVTLELPSNWKQDGGRILASIAPRGQQVITFVVRAESDAPVGRAVVNAFLVDDSGASVRGVPVDIEVE